MNTVESSVGFSIDQLSSELGNLEKITRSIMPRPGSIPSLDGFEIYGETLPLNGVVGGDHLIYVDFKKRYDLDARIARATTDGLPEIVANLERCRRIAGVALIDVSGHQATDAMLAAMFHQAFLLGILYELDTSGQVTKRLLENLNQRFYNSSSVDKFITAIHGEISEDATFRFLLAGHPPPIVFSAAYDRFMDVDPHRYTACPPLGTLPSECVFDRNRATSVLGFKGHFEVNEWTLMGTGDILLLYTDGLQDHGRHGEPYFPGPMEQTVRRAKNLSAVDIVQSVLDDVRAFADPSDDVSLVVIKRL